jgi:transcriptional regulator with XRE-family HTH domain
MNATGYQHGQVDPEEWDRPEMRAVLAERNITRVYRLLQKIGFSQQHIAALTGQSQPEVSAIIHGRKVMAYDVLSRICEGLGVPRGSMGLAYDKPPAKEAVEPPCDHPDAVHGQVSAATPDEPHQQEPDQQEEPDRQEEQEPDQQEESDQQEGQGP